MNPSLAVYKTLYKSLPPSSRAAFRQQWTKLSHNNYTKDESLAIQNVMRSMIIHDEYLKFFNIAQKKDEMAKIEKVSRYVGLGLPKVKKHDEV